MGSIEFDDSGFKKLQKSLEEISEPQQVSFDVLLDTTFMQQFTEYSSFAEMICAGGYTVNSQEDFKKIPDADFDQHVKQHTQFASWDEMLSKAAEKYYVNKLNL